MINLKKANLRSETEPMEEKVKWFDSWEIKTSV